MKAKNKFFYTLLALMPLVLQACGVFYIEGRWHHGGGRHRPWRPAPSESALHLSQDKAISLVAAEKIVSLAGGNDSRDALAKMEIEEKDVAPLADLQMPSNESIDRMAKGLGEDRSKIENLLTGFISDMKTDMKAEGN